MAADKFTDDSPDGFALPLFPRRAVAVLLQQQDESYDFIISFRPGHRPDPGLNREGAEPLVLLNAVALRLRVSDALVLAARPDVEQVWYQHPDTVEARMQLLRALDHVVLTLPRPGLVNLSIGPAVQHYREEPEPESPEARALEALARHDFVIVAAIGNCGETAPGFVNPWSIPRAVISVGASDQRTGRLWPGSATGRPDCPETWPDLVAQGVDVISTWPGDAEKSPQRRATDEASPAFRAQVPREKWDLYTMMSGTSQACASVCGLAGQILHACTRLTHDWRLPLRQKVMEMTVRRPDGAASWQPERLTGEVISEGPEGVTIEYWADQPWRMVKQILIDLTQPVPEARPWQAGAGVIDPQAVAAQFGGFGHVPARIYPIRIK